jgi:hypothetical protein
MLVVMMIYGNYVVYTNGRTNRICQKYGIGVMPIIVIIEKVGLGRRAGGIDVVQGEKGERQE